MKTSLDRLLESIDPDKALQQVSAQVDNALNSFPMNSGIVDNWDAFLSVIGKFYRHTENTILGIPSFQGGSADFEWSRAVRFLDMEYGNSGSKAAFEKARTGIGGGVYSVLKIIAKHMVEEYAGNEISARINAFWNQLSINERLFVADEYLSKYGHLLPSELTEGSAARIRVNFVKVLHEHPQLIRRMRNINYA
jgi:hypothetical protein